MSDDTTTMTTPISKTCARAYIDGLIDALDLYLSSTLIPADHRAQAQRHRDILGQAREIIREHEQADALDGLFEFAHEHGPAN